MRVMWHVRSRRLLSAYVDEALDPRTRIVVRRHLERCSECQRALEEIKSGSRLAKLARQHYELNNLALARLFHSLSQGSPRKQRKSTLGWALGLAAVALAVVLALSSYFDGPFKIRGTQTQVAQAGSLPLNLFLQEANDPGNRVRNGTDAYEFMASSPEELSQRAAQVLPEPDLPPGCSFRRGFIYRQRYGGAIGRVYAALDGRIICLLDQPIKARVAYGDLKPQRRFFCGKYCRELRWPSLRLLTWETGSRRTLLLTNLKEDQLEEAFVHYPGLH